MYRKQVAVPILLIATLLLVACAQAATPSPPATEEATRTLAPTATTVSATAAPLAVDLETLPTPTQLPDYRWDQLLGWDDIAPIYDPIFVSADATGYEDAELVMGVEIDGAAKAYPVGLLNQREMVSDELAGIPILVTW